MRKIVHWIRRGHLYLGLFLFPWAILYGVTGFLFNHPTAFSDRPTASFGADALAGTPLDGLPSPSEQAEEVLRLLNEKHKSASPYRIVGEAKYAREIAFATVKAEGQTIGVLVDLKNSRGTVRSSPAEAPKKVIENAPFAVGRVGSKTHETERPSADAIQLESPLPGRVKAAIPTILERTGFPSGEVTVTSVPDLTFQIEAEGRIWIATYNATTGTVSGKPAEAEEKPTPSVRAFLIRLHLSHGYPGEQDARWFWAVIVDGMAIVLCFWGLSGLIMWWQIRSTRKAGAVLLLLSAGSAIALGIGMYSVISG